MTETVFWVLTALTAGRRHGYAVLRDVDELSGGTVVLRVTTLYASLERLVAEGRVVVAGEEVVDGRARRYYEITPTGRHDLQVEAERLAVRAAAARARMAVGTIGSPRPAAASAVIA